MYTLQQKNKFNAKSNDNLNKTISSTLTYYDQNKKKFPKTYSH